MKQKTIALEPVLEVLKALEVHGATSSPEAQLMGAFDLATSLRGKTAMNALNARHSPRRKLKEQAADVAKKEWVNGSTLLHHEMKRFLVEDYQDENGKYPFVNLPDRALLDTLKQVARELNRPNLISGQKK